MLKKFSIRIRVVRTTPPKNLRPRCSILKMEGDYLGVFAHGDTARERGILWGCSHNANPLRILNFFNICPLGQKQILFSHI